MGDIDEWVGWVGWVGKVGGRGVAIIYMMDYPPCRTTRVLFGGSTHDPGSPP